jgi:hypothetical protein
MSAETYWHPDHTKPIDTSKVGIGSPMAPPAPALPSEPSVATDATKVVPAPSTPPEAPEEIDPETGHPYGFFNSLAKGINGAVNAVIPAPLHGNIYTHMRDE